MVPLVRDGPWFVIWGKQVIAVSKIAYIMIFSAFLEGLGLELTFSAFDSAKN